MSDVRQIRVPPEYFKKAKDEYSNWGQAWWREAIQNALDADATELNIYYQNLNEHEIEVVFADNGHGMSEDTLLNVFLALGGSQKKENNIGGFGYAKSLLCFAQNEYTIRTGNNLIQGAGGEYTHELMGEEVKGVELRVIMSRQDASIAWLDHHLKQILNASAFPKDLVIIINGERFTPEPLTLKYKKETDIGLLRFDDHPHSYSELWVRMGGLAMFPVCVYTSDSHFRGTLDLAGDSKLVLTSNRDSLRDAQGRVLNQLINKLSSERGSLKCSDLIDLTLNFDERFSGNVGEVIDDTPEIDPNAPRVGTIRTTSLMNVTQEDAAKLGLAEPDESDQPDSAFGRLAQKRAKALRSLLERSQNVNSRGYPPCFRIRTAELSVDGKKSPTAVYNPILKKLSQTRLKRLAIAWDTVVRAILSMPAAAMKGIDYTNDEHRRAMKDGRRINTGFVFSDTLEGLHLKHPEGAYDVLINPDVMPKIDLEELVDVATHELTHLWVAGHNESFTTLELGLRRAFRKFMPIPELRKVVKQAIEKELGTSPALRAERPSHSLSSESYTPPESTPIQAPAADDRRPALEPSSVAGAARLQEAPSQPAFSGQSQAHDVPTPRPEPVSSPMPGIQSAHFTPRGVKVPAGMTPPPF